MYKYACVHKYIICMINLLCSSSGAVTAVNVLLLFVPLIVATSVFAALFHLKQLILGKLHPEKRWNVLIVKHCWYVQLWQILNYVTHLFLSHKVNIQRLNMPSDWINNIFTSGASVGRAEFLRYFTNSYVTLP